ncbi:MAG: hypothetical protein H7255_10950 [Ramlibacter sp.]|nr:hypothetical protein [Ramlibacter sp.]
MTQFRDARLQRALDAAPDAQLRPDARVWASILDAARAAVEPSQPVSHWKKWWNVTGSASPAWNAAFASIALASLVTLLWYDREIPDAGVTSPSADKQAPGPLRPASVATAPAAPAVAKPAPTPAPAPAPALVQAPERPVSEVARQSPREPAKDQQLKNDPGAGQSVGAATNAAAQQSTAARAEERQRASQAANQEARDDKRAADAMRDQAAPALAKSAPAPAAKAEAAAQAPVPMAAPPTSAFQTRSASVDGNWTQATIQARGRSVRIERAQSDALYQLLLAVGRSPVSSQAMPGGQPLLRIELTLPGGTDIVEVIGAQVRWTRVRDNQPLQLAIYAPESAQLQALQAEAERLLNR